MILTFKNATKVLKASAKLKAAGIPHQVKPTPRTMQISCGLCIEIDDAHAEQAKQLITQN